MINVSLMIKRKSFRAILFLSILMVLFFISSRVLGFKYVDGIYSMKKFYEQDKGTVDVLALGSSHMFESVNTSVLFEEYGIACYDLGGSVQPMWNTYYYLKEALKYQQPKLILLEGYMLTFCDYYSDDSRIIKNTYGLRWSVDRIRAVRVSTPPDRFSEFLVSFVQYHSRYSDLSAADFLPDCGDPELYDFKGFTSNPGKEMFDNPAAELEGAGPLNPKTEEYFRKTLELGGDFHIPVLVFIAPYPGITQAHWEQFHTGEEITGQEGMVFWNAMREWEEIGLDFKTDFADADHLNGNGNVKFTRYLGTWIRSHFTGIPDRRGDCTFAGWERNSEYLREKALTSR